MNEEINLDMNKILHYNELAKYTDFPLKVQYGYVESYFGMHSHDFTELVIVTSGYALHQIDNETYAVSAGDVCVLSDDVFHGFHEAKDLNIYNVMFEHSKMSVQTNELKQIPGFQALFALDKLYTKDNSYKCRMKLSKNQLTEIEGLLEKMSHEYKIGSNGFRTMMQAYFTNLVILLSRYFDEGSSVVDDRISKIADAIAFIEKHFTDNLSINQLSSIAHLSDRHFTRIFSEIFDISPMEYIITLRLNYARLLLLQKDTSITEVSISCGFCDSNYFSRIFKKVCGMSPREFRNSKSKKMKGTVFDFTI